MNAQLFVTSAATTARSMQVICHTHQSYCVQVAASSADHVFPDCVDPALCIGVATFVLPSPK